MSRDYLNVGLVLALWALAFAISAVIHYWPSGW